MEDAALEVGFGFAGVDADGGLQDDGAGVEVVGDDVGAAAGAVDAGGDSLADGMQTLERRQEAGVDVDDAVGEGRDDGGADDAHVAGKDDDVGAFGA